MSSDLSAGSAIPSTSFIHSMEMLREMISKANTSGNHYNISVDELRMLQSSLIEARSRQDYSDTIKDAEDEIHKLNLGAPKDLESDPSFQAAA